MVNSSYPKPNRRDFPKLVHQLAISFLSRLLFVIEPCRRTDCLSSLSFAFGGQSALGAPWERLGSALGAPWGTERRCALGAPFGGQSFALGDYRISGTERPWGRKLIGDRAVELTLNQDPRGAHFKIFS
jgi:hypothetical protein